MIFRLRKIISELLMFSIKLFMDIQIICHFLSITLDIPFCPIKYPTEYRFVSSSPEVFTLMSENNHGRLPSKSKFGQVNSGQALLKQDSRKDQN